MRRRPRTAPRHRAAATQPRRPARRRPPPPATRARGRVRHRRRRRRERRRAASAARAAGRAARGVVRSLSKAADAGAAAAAAPAEARVRAIVAEYRTVLPQQFATDLVLRFRVPPGSAITRAQRAVAARMARGEPDPRRARRRCSTSRRPGGSRAVSEGIRSRTGAGRGCRPVVGRDGSRLRPRARITGTYHFYNEQREENGSRAVAGVGAGQGKPWTGATAQCHWKIFCGTHKLTSEWGHTRDQASMSWTFATSNVFFAFVSFGFDDIIEQHLALSTSSRFVITPLCILFLFLLSPFDSTQVLPQILQLVTESGPQ